MTGTPPEVGRVGGPSPADLDAFLSDLASDAVLDGDSARPWTGTGVARAVACPPSASEVSSLLKRAGRAGITVHPAGAGSWPDAGGWARAADLALSTRRLGRIHHYEPADLTLSADAGVKWAELEAVTGSQGQWLPLDPPGVLDATLGGVVASGVSGPLRGQYGGVRDSVLGVRVVTGDGRELRVGGRVVKNVAGYDLVRLLTGSRGSLGVITEVSVRLFPRPAADVTDLFHASDGALPDLARRTAEAPFPLAAVELVDDGPDGPVGLAVRTVGTLEEVEDTRRRLARRLGSEPARTLEGSESRDWHRTRTRWEDDAGLVVRLSALPGLLPPVWDLAGSLSAVLSGTRTAHVGQGVVRVRAAAPEEETLDALTRVGGEVGRGVAELGGGVIVSKAGRDVRAVTETMDGWRRSAGPVDELTRRIRALFDPAGTLGPRRP